MIPISKMNKMQLYDFNFENEQDAVPWICIEILEKEPFRLAYHNTVLFFSFVVCRHGIIFSMKEKNPYYGSKVQSTDSKLNPKGKWDTNSYLQKKSDPRFL